MTHLLKPRIVTTTIADTYQGDETVTSTTHTETQYRLAADDRLTVSRCGIVLERGKFLEDRETVRIDFYDQPQLMARQVADMVRTLRSSMESTDSDSYRQECQDVLYTIRTALG